MQKKTDVWQLLVNPSSTLLVFYVAVCSAFVTFCLKTHASFWSGFRYLIGSVFFGFIMAYASMRFMGINWGILVSLVCSMFTGPVYSRFEKVGPRELFRRLIQKNGNNE